MICPRCGANLPLQPGVAYVACQYCGTQSPVQAAPPPPQAAPVASRRKSGFPVGCIVALALGLLVATGGAVAAFALFGVSLTPARVDASSVSPAKETSKTESLSVTRSSTSTSSVTTTTSTTSASTLPDIESRFAPLVSDLNGDGAPDFVVPASLLEKGLTRSYFGFDGVTGKELFRTKDLGGTIMSAQAALEHGRLLIADSSGKVTGFDVRSGDEQWSTTLGDRVRSFCVAKEADSVRVETADDRIIALDVKTGRQSPVAGKAKCERANTNSKNEFKLPEDRSDSDAPRGVKSVVCGSVRVMGDRNFFVPDQCPIQTGINPDKLDGMAAGAFWKVGKGWLVLGFRKPGTRIPMLGYHAGGKLVWKRDVPPRNPLEAREGSPEKVAIAGDRAFAVFDAKDSNQPSGITAFEIESGAPRWAVVLKNQRQTISQIAAVGETVVVISNGQALGFGAADGKQRFTVGKSD
jgi:hypothetical protein